MDNEVDRMLQIERIRYGGGTREIDAYWQSIRMMQIANTPYVPTVEASLTLDDQLEKEDERGL